MTIKISNRAGEFKDYKLLLLVSHFNDYEMAHFLELATGLHFKKYADFPFATGNKEPYEFSWYHYSKEDDFARYYLLYNGSRGKYLFPELKNIDFLLFVKGAVPQYVFNRLKESIRNIRGVTAVFTHDVGRLSDVQLFFDEMEIHELEYVIKPVKEEQKKIKEILAKNGQKDKSP